MINTVVGAFHHCFIAFQGYERILESDDSTDTVAKLLERLAALRGYCERLELDLSVKQLDWLAERIDSGTSKSAIPHYIRSATIMVEKEAETRYVYHIAREKAELYAKELLIWERIILRFPSIQLDALSALNCYILDESTACVFRLMRVAEIGLRALARERRVSIPRKPLEWATWQDILARIKKSVDTVAMWKAGPAKEAALEFYRGAQGEFESFKDTYRNNVMHSRQSYDEHRAASVLVHVRDFMERLAFKIDERSIKAIRWGRK
jgi:hypothetical protein